MSTILEKIAAVRRERLQDEMRGTKLDVLESLAKQNPPALDFCEAMKAPGIHVIAEVKKASPSAGTIRNGVDPRELALCYQRGGASAISVLTEKDHFRGDLLDLKKVREAVSLPLLRKDFIIDPYQVVEARAAGADSFLLITALLDRLTLESFLRIGREWGMEPVVEVHTREELDVALEGEARLIGINNRDLATFKVDIDTSLKLAAYVPPDRVVISESGIRTGQDVARLEAAGVRAVLVGEALVRASNVSAKIGELVHAI